MNYYLIDDKADNIRQIRESIRRMRDKCSFFWIDESGNKKGINTPVPTVPLKFGDPITEEFKSRITDFIGRDNMFLIDLSLCDAEDDAVKKKYVKKEAGAGFTASIASQIIRAIKEADTDARVKVISRIWRGRYPEEVQWREPLNELAGEPWFGTVRFVPTEFVIEAYESDEALRYLNA